MPRGLTGTVRETTWDHGIERRIAIGVAFLLLLLCAATTARAAGTKTPTPRPTPKLVAITLEPAELTRFVGDSKSYTATGTFSDGRERNVTQQLEYKSSNTRVAEATNEDGNRSLVLAVGPGTATISATDPVTGVTSKRSDGDAVLTVRERPTETPTPDPTPTEAGEPTRTRTPTPRPTAKLVSIKLEPAELTRFVGQERSYTATGKFANGITRNITQQLVYRSSKPDVAEATNDATNKSRVVARAPGKTTISALHPGTGVDAEDSDGDAELTVVEGPTVQPTIPGQPTGSPTPRPSPRLVSIKLEPATTTRSVGQERNYLATGTLEDGNTRVVTQQVTFSSSDPAVAEAKNPSQNHGTVKAVGPGTAIISALHPGTGVSSTTSGGDATMIVSAPGGPGGTPGTPGPTPTPFGLGLEDPAAAELATECREAIAKAGARLVGVKLKALARCAGALAHCIQAPSGAQGPEVCSATAGTRCAAALGKLADERARLAASVARGCDDAPLSFADLLDADGLGYAALGTECAAGPPDSIEELSACITTALDCHTERLVALLAPRAKELLRAAHFPFPQLDPLTCLPDHGGSGLGVVDPDDGKALERCEKTIKRGGTRFVTNRLRSIEKCTDGVFACLQNEPQDVTCVIRRARSKCGKAFGRIVDETTRLDEAVLRDCGALDFASMLGAEDGANVAALEDACAAVGVGDLATLADYRRCLARALDCASGEVLHFISPRAAQLLPLVRRAATGRFCPTPISTASPVPTPTATPTATDTPTPAPTATV